MEKGEIEACSGDEILKRQQGWKNAANTGKEYFDYKQNYLYA